MHLLTLLIFTLPSLALAVDCTSCVFKPCGCGAFQCNSTEVPVYPQKSFEKGLQSNGSDTALPLVDRDFIYQVFPVCPCTYLHSDSSCNVNTNSGIYLGAEINLMKTMDPANSQFNDSNGISLYSIATAVVANSYTRAAKLCPSLATGINSCVRSYSAASVQQISGAYLDSQAIALSQMYDGCSMGTKFAELPRAIRTALFLSHYVALDPVVYARLWRAFAQQNWEGAVSLMSETETNSQDALNSTNSRRQRFLMESANVAQCASRNASMSIVILADSAKTDTVNGMIKEFVTFWAKRTNSSIEQDYDVYVSIVWQTTGGANYSSLAKVGQATSAYTIPVGTVHGSLDLLLEQARSAFWEKLTNSINVLIYIGDEVFLDEGASGDIFVQLLELERQQTLMYAIKTHDNIQASTNLKLMARTSDVVYIASELGALCDAIDLWTNYSCAMPYFVNSSYTYRAGANITNYFAYFGSSADEKSRNMTVTITPQVAGSLVVYYSTQFSHPGVYLRDGTAVASDGKLLLEFSYTKAPNSTVAVEYYYSVTSARDQMVTVNATVGVSTSIGKCESGCSECDIMGQRCKTCVQYYENIRGKCVKAFTEEQVPISNQRFSSMYPIYLGMIGTIGVAGVLACIVSGKKLEEEKCD